MEARLRRIQAATQMGVRPRPKNDGIAQCWPNGDNRRCSSISPDSPRRRSSTRPAWTAPSFPAICRRPAIYRTRDAVTLARSASEGPNTFPRLRFGLVSRAADVPFLTACGIHGTTGATGSLLPAWIRRWRASRLNPQNSTNWSTHTGLVFLSKL